jgi:hypothetical protein
MPPSGDFLATTSADCRIHAQHLREKAATARFPIQGPLLRYFADRWDQLALEYASLDERPPQRPMDIV